MKKIILKIEGMTCSACSNGLEKYLNKKNGIYNANVNLVMNTASIDYDDEILTIDHLNQFIYEAGFKSAGKFKNFDEEKNNNKKEFIFFTILAIVLLFFSFLNMLNIYNNKYLLLTIAILFLIYGFDIIKKGIKNLIHLIPNMDSLITIGVLSGFIYSLVMINTNNHLYFESTGIVIYFVKLGRLLAGINKDKTKDAIKELAVITPNQATILRKDKEINVTLDEIKKGDIVICKPGDKIAVDGIIIEGEAHLDESFITGESKPQIRSINDEVIAGSLNYDGFIKYKAERIGRDSVISEIVNLVIEANNSKIPIAKTVDKISSVFVPTILVLAIISFILNINDINIAITRFISVLVVACPCSLGLATPLAIIVSEGLCINKGILVKKGEILEIASKTDMIVFDKTGTLTYGNLKIANITNYGNKDILKIAASLEKLSSHPIATAFNDVEDTYKVKNFKNIPGVGIEGEINGDKIKLGNDKIIKKGKIKSNNTIIYVVINNNLEGIIEITDLLRDNSKDVITNIKKMGIEAIMLTGDNIDVAKEIGNQIGIKKIIANVMPKEKEKIIKELQKEEKIVLMCGDGINDSPSLSRSNIGVSMKNATKIAAHTSDVILLNNNLEGIIELINISKKTIMIIKQNLFWSFIYNAIMIPIAMGLFKFKINPIMASLAMIFSSLSIIINTLRLKKANNN